MDDPDEFHQDPPTEQGQKRTYESVYLEPVRRSTVPGSFEADLAAAAGLQTETDPSARKRFAAADVITDRPFIAQSTRARLILRALLTKRESGIVIGKGGVNVSEMRRESRARIHLEEMGIGSVERVVLVQGALDVISKVLELAFTFRPIHWLQVVWLQNSKPQQKEKQRQLFVY